ncbi:hypothetical protein BBOV_I002250 [Babesia bovis T2Bo]|uniref:Uncharacterized protein n=1 Tax=Babesia bovis TaxID=5865 RepID=A7AW79_BABBO|nr:hypothetical protein BBOV_I002250 [Babesia bovis T2Bo]EDO05307.1 hypothetical protein BBOV_I002250 [Babesia bovis T2Bo]|eukprot:XP_001608875.1 hypothetical protein [Babesia bovis T2Bo]
MNFVRTQNYSGDKASGGLIDFTKGSLVEASNDVTRPKERQKRENNNKEVQFKPKELFSDRDIEGVVENLTSATAIASAFSEEDIAHLENLEKKRNQQWKRRKLEEEEYAKEAERIRNSLGQKEDIDHSSDDSNLPTLDTTPSLFPKTQSQIRLTPKICVIERNISTRDTNQPSSINKSNNLPLIEGYSSDED